MYVNTVGTGVMERRLEESLEAPGIELMHPQGAE